VITWHIVTGEYPPQPGGVSDYTFHVARALQSNGDAVHVWCPGRSQDCVDENGVLVHRVMGQFRVADMWRGGAMLNRYPRPRRVLVQYVPHAYGSRAVNLPFCIWLYLRALKGDVVFAMVHETYMEFGPSLRQKVGSLIQRAMAILLVRAATRIWCSIDTWRGQLQKYACSRTRFELLPVPSNINVVVDPTGVTALRRSIAADAQPVIGHFGTFGNAITHTLLPAVCALLQKHDSMHLLLIGRGSRALRQEVLASQSGSADRVHAVEDLSHEDISRYLQVCDVMIQPFSEGVTTRRTTLMAGLCHGKAIVTAAGFATEPLWRESGAVCLVPSGDATGFADAVLHLLGDPNGRRLLGERGRDLYEQRFGIDRVIERMRAAVKHANSPG
jgi:glycosyltransferase involved in cell wall biosynthesis